MPFTSRFHGVRQGIDTGSATLVHDHAPVGWSDLRHEIDTRMRVLPPNRFNMHIICVLVTVEEQGETDTVFVKA